MPRIHHLVVFLKQKALSGFTHSVNCCTNLTNRTTIPLSRSGNTRASKPSLQANRTCEPAAFPRPSARFSSAGTGGRKGEGPQAIGQSRAGLSAQLPVVLQEPSISEPFLHLKGVSVLDQKASLLLPTNSLSGTRSSLF